MWLSKFQLMIMDNTKSYKNPKNGFKRLEKSWVYSSLCNNDKNNLEHLICAAQFSRYSNSKYHGLNV